MPITPSYRNNELANRLMQYRREIDGLRAIAVIPVILFHAGFTIFSGGYVGVDIFFVISGYLITSIIISELEQGRFSILRFYERRARRILPALFFVMLVCVPFAWMWMLPSQFKEFSQSLIAVSLFASNILFWRESGYFAAASEEKPLLHTWSLAVEEQYYMLFPIFLILLWRFGRSPVFYSIIVISIISLALSEWGWRNEPTANFYFSPSRAWELLAGSICAFLQNGKTQKSSDALSAFGFVLIVFSIFYYDASTPFPSVYALAPVVGTALIILYGARETWVAKLLSLKAVVGIGLISYSAYLWHQPLFAFARIKNVAAPEQLLMLLLAIASLMLAYFSWRFVELPFRNRTSPVIHSQRAIFGVAIIVGTTFISFGAYIDINDGVTSLYKTSDLQKGYLKTAISSPMRESCHTRGENFTPPESACEYFEDDISVAVFGDSHTVELAYALAKTLAPYQIGIKHLSFSGCGPQYELENFSSPCAEWTQQAINYIENNKSITHVIVSYRITSPLNTNDLAKAEQTQDALLSILQRFSNVKNVIYVMQSPELPVRIENLIYQNKFDLNFKILGAKIVDWHEMRRTFDSFLATKLENYNLFDPEGFFCTGEYCIAGANGNSYYFDKHHLSVLGAELFSGKIAQIITGTQ